MHSSLNFFLLTGQSKSRDKETKTHAVIAAHSQSSPDRESSQTLRLARAPGSFPLFDHNVIALQARNNVTAARLHSPSFHWQTWCRQVITVHLRLSKARKTANRQYTAQYARWPSVSVTWRARVSLLCKGQFTLNPIWSHCTRQQLIVWRALISTSSDSSQLPVMVDPPAALKRESVCLCE